MRHRILKSLAISACLLGLGVVGANAPHVHTPTVATAHASTMSQLRQDVYWTDRINTYARHSPTYYPRITYNTRDFGGLRAKDGQITRSGVLYRSANLHYLKRRGANQIKRLNIHQDIDLRAWNGPNSSIHAKPQPGEIRSMPDRYGIHMHYHVYPVESSRQEAYTWPIRKRLGETYRFGYWYTLNPDARRAYHDSVDYIAKPKTGPIMINCTQGRDRTGVLSIIIEALLGVSKRNIYKEFLMTNYYKYQSPYADQVSRINRFYNTVYHNYGTMWHYCRSRRGLNISWRTIKNLRHKFGIK